jgi:hypothetical protein
MDNQSTPTWTFSFSRKIGSADKLATKWSMVRLSCRIASESGLHTQKNKYSFYAKLRLAEDNSQMDSLRSRQEIFETHLQHHKHRELQLRKICSKATVQKCCSPVLREANPNEDSLPKPSMGVSLPLAPSSPTWHPRACSVVHVQLLETKRCCSS